MKKQKENEALKNFLASDVGKKTIQKIATLQNTNKHLKSQLSVLEGKYLELEAKYNRLKQLNPCNSIEDEDGLSTLDEEVAARNFMEDVVSAYRAAPVSTYLFSICDEKGNERRIYSKTLEKQRKEMTGPLVLSKGE